MHIKKLSILAVLLFFLTLTVSCNKQYLDGASSIVAQAVQIYINTKAASHENGKVENPYGSVSLSAKKSYIANKKIMLENIDGTVAEFKIKGICYAPDIDGELYFQDYKKDLPLIKALNANSIRTYRPLGSSKADGTFHVGNTMLILDECLQEDLMVAVGFSYEDMAPGGAMEEYLKMFGKHPVIFMIVLGNEYNYHYGEWFSKDEWFKRIAQAMPVVKQYAPGKIIATVHGEMPSQEELDEYVRAGFDLVMPNIYRGSNFGFSKDNWYKMTNSMPWVLGEFGRGSKDAKGNDTSKLQVSYLESQIRSMEQGYLFTLVDDPAKGKIELNPNIGREDSMGVFDHKRNPKPAAAAVREEYSSKNN
ncbi:MAG: hypothetical protein FWF00_05850 [Endomicrobia bacterium]|nr:hypothetical protein [Endomicrobiia bacterium]MCL2507189.1 hypothetical protein [Endomicrobiia bacterium]